MEITLTGLKWATNPVPTKRTHCTHYLVIVFIGNVKNALKSLLNPINIYRIFFRFFWWNTRSPSFLFGSKAEAQLILIISYRSPIVIVIRLRLRSGMLVSKRTKFSLRFIVQRIDPCSFPSTPYACAIDHREIALTLFLPLFEIIVKSVDHLLHYWRGF